MIRVLSQADLSPLLPRSHHCGCWALGPGLLPLPCPPAAGGATRAHTWSATTSRRRGTVPPTPSSYLRGSYVLPASSSARHAINLPCGPLSASRAPHPAQGPQGLPPPPAPPPIPGPGRPPGTSPLRTPSSLRQASWPILRGVERSLPSRILSAAISEAPVRGRPPG